MLYKIGRVKDYNGIKGNIITKDDNYFFLDVDTNNDINIGDLVRFRPENVQNENRAFFVKKLVMKNEKNYITINNTEKEQS